jgi:hypothetical protein
MLQCGHETERVREKIWDYLPDGLPLVATRPDQGQALAFWDDHRHGRRGRRASGEKGRHAGGDLCAGFLSQAKREPGSASGKAGRLGWNWGRRATALLRLSRWPLVSRQRARSHPFRCQRQLQHRQKSIPDSLWPRDRGHRSSAASGLPSKLECGGRFVTISGYCC